MIQEHKKLSVLILCGGKSAEHEVSLRSAQNVIRMANPQHYEVQVVYINPAGQWHLLPSSQVELIKSGGVDALPKLTGESVTPIASNEQMSLLPIASSVNPMAIDVVFPVLHGTFGEDGTMQGLLKLLDVPFVGPSVLGSAIGMDKEITKRLLKEQGIPVAKFMVIHTDHKDLLRFDDVVKQLGLPFFLKPANAGSSVGVHKVTKEEEFSDALCDAFQYDCKVLLEEYIPGRELECAVLGNEEPVASVIGEVMPVNDFYSYDAKYIDPNGATTQIPASLDETTMKAIQALAIETFKTLQCEGMARVDFFLSNEGAILVNEINTLPGFTSISMYPKLWEASGMSPSDLFDNLVLYAIERHNKEKALKTTF